MLISFVDYTGPEKIAQAAYDAGPESAKLPAVEAAPQTAQNATKPEGGMSIGEIHKYTSNVFLLVFACVMAVDQ